MKDLSIEVSSIANVVSNGDFELWENSTPLNWTATNGTGSVGYTNSLWGLGVNLVSAGTDPRPQIEQEIPVTANVSYKLGIWHNKDISIKVYNGGTDFLEENVTSNQWRFREFTFIPTTSTVTIQLKKRYYTTETMSAQIDNVYVYRNDWYDNKLPLKVSQIKEFENFTREIEDDLFTFKSDALSFTIRNYGSDGSYFNTNDFETYSERIFRFDILATYDGTNGNDIVKKMVLFSNNDTIKKTREPLSDDLTIQLYELSSLFKDNGWFLGSVVADEDTEETYWKYNTYNGTDPSIVASSVSVSGVLSKLTDDIKDLIQRHFVPIPLSNFKSDNQLVSGDEIIGIEYDWIINTASGKYVLLDVVSSPSSNRVYCMMLLYDRIGADLTDNDIKIWEIVNGSTLVELETPTMGWTSDINPVLGQECSIGFVHEFNSSTFYNGSTIEFIVVLNIDLGSTYSYRYKSYTNNSGTSIAGGNYNDTNEDDIKLYFKQDWQPTSSTALLRQNKCLYVDDNGLPLLRTYYAQDDNMLWIETYPNITGTEGNYSLSNIASLGTDAAWTMKYATTLNASIYRFPQYYTFIFKDAYPSDILKDICVSQDAVWYLDYATTSDNIYLTIKNRVIDETPTAFNDNRAIREDSFVRRIKFSDLDGTIFRDDATRLNYYLAYYNSTYGGGRYEKEFQVWGYRSYSLNDILSYDGNSYFVKRFEYETNERKTYLTLFQGRT